MTFDLALAKDIVRNADLPPVKKAPLGIDKNKPGFVFEQAQEQALVVGSEVIGFADTVDAKVREAISNSALLAQLMTTQKMGTNEDPLAWFDSYFALLAQLGWVVQERDEATYKIKGSGLEVHEAIKDVLELFLGGTPSALKLALGALAGLKSMKKDAPFITLFNKESQHGEVGRFHFTTVRRDPTHGLLIEIMAFSLKANEKLTQILFFKLTKTKSELQRNLARMSINETALEQMKPVIAGRIKAHQATFIASLPLPALV